MVITGLTRNQFAGNRTWVRIPPAAPWVSPYRTHPFQLVKERRFSKHEDWRFIIKRGKNHDIGSKIRSIPLPNSNLFEIHGSIFKPHPSRNPGQTSVVRIPHGVLFFCISKNTLYGLFSHGIEFLATFGFSQMFDQIEIFLPDMSCEYPLSALICATNSSAGTVFADFG